MTRSTDYSAKIPIDARELGKETRRCMIFARQFFAILQWCLSTITICALECSLFRTKRDIETKGRITREAN